MIRMNDNDRLQWCNNDEGLSRMMLFWIRSNHRGGEMALKDKEFFDAVRLHREDIINALGLDDEDCQDKDKELRNKIANAIRDLPDNIMDMIAYNLGESLIDDGYWNILKEIAEMVLDEDTNILKNGELKKD